MAPFEEHSTKLVSKILAQGKGDLLSISIDDLDSHVPFSALSSVRLRNTR